jgi:hypothetical protein
MGLFDFMSMAGNYAERKVSHYEQAGVCVDTCAINDSTKPFETGVVHPKYNNGRWIIVELYDTKKDAQVGHNKWVKTMTTKKLPKRLKDVSTCEVAVLAFGGAESKRRTIQKRG